MSESQILNKIKAVARQIFPDCKVILFGSRARKDYSVNSDYDILVVIDKTLSAEDKISFRTKIRKELLKFKILTDILIQSNSELKIKKELTGHIVKTILSEGIIL